MKDFLARAVWEGRLYSGMWRDATAIRTVVEPATGAELGRLGAATLTDVDRAVNEAVDAQREWAEASYVERARILRRAAQLFVAHSEDIAEWASCEAGIVRAGALRQGPAASEECLQAAELASMPYGDVLRSAQARLSFARRMPVGVVGVIAPFNAPILLAIRALAPALALGNSVVLKPDPRTAVTGGATFARIFEEAGLPAGLLHVLPGEAEIGARLVTHPRVPVLAFTGSTAGGRSIAVEAAKQLKRVHLELGGNSALIVADDADVERAAAAGAAGTFRHQGQICMASGRHLVHEAIADEYANTLAELAGSMPMGDPRASSTAVGPLIDASQCDRVHELVTGSIESGATALTGGSYDGLFYRPTVLTGVTDSTPAYANEVFGPVAPVRPFRDLDEAARLAADSPYGLALGVITKDVMKGLALADKVPTGALHINDQTINDEPVAPFGGRGDSGNGARHGGHAANLEAFTEQQWVTVRAEPPSYPSTGRRADR